MVTRGIVTTFNCDQCDREFNRDGDTPDKNIGFLDINEDVRALIITCCEDCCTKRVAALKVAYPKWLPTRNRP